MIYQIDSPNRVKIPYEDAESFFKVRNELFDREGLKLPRSTSQLSAHPQGGPRFDYGLWLLDGWVSPIIFLDLHVSIYYGCYLGHLSTLFT